MRNSDLIEFCEGLTARAKSGELEGFIIVELREGDRIICHCKEVSESFAHKAVSFAGAAIWQDVDFDEIVEPRF